ncbi:Endosome-associated ubiquitin isopeptidase [Pyrenophora tritici-repentis]|uniref:JAB multi-domain protein n=1 Tax=Pyrenophora tritici-repentis TaxID=45151 RepID=A0A834VJP5_9PLEO|nr:JAB multi-domain protein [Pyrenophora tritici-repentis]KAI0571704.1 Endosome-associated ubiquitin isopeptidase [Pyrenophora tritici-repentis]KAI0574294.1 Endosome-associated ubiquitin isopeptidase [Pyrenophora tritici-repentis]
MATLNTPVSVAEVAEQAGNYTYNVHIPLANWLRTANTMQKEAQVYEAEGNDAQTYLLLYRHADLVLQKLQAHPDRNKPENRKALNAATAAVSRDLKKLEEIAPRIKKRHEEYEERRKRQQQALKSLEGKGARTLPLELDGLSLQDPGTKRRSYDSRPTIDARVLENQSLAARLAQREVRRRDTNRRTARQHGVSEEEEQARRSGGSWDRWQDDLSQQAGDGDDVSSQIQEVARLQQNGHRTSYSSERPTSQSSSSYHYPTVPYKTSQERWDSSRDPVPTRPPKEQIYSSSASPASPPPLPPKYTTSPHDARYQHGPPPVPGKYSESAPPLPGKVPDPRSITPSNELDEFTFKPSAFLENGDPLRPVFLPSQLRNQFLASASSNTRLNLETCGMLCGILKSNALFITRLIIPEQTSTSDTCETLNEEELFDYCDKEELMVLGWIHTHPTQTCFMSSRDLHTHVGYQVMMPESIAIVCAPTKQPSWGCFRLTDPPGKQAILNCSRPGIFHPHDVDNIYTEALKPGHVVELTNAPLEIVDMRPKKRF